MARLAQLVLATSSLIQLVHSRALVQDGSLPLATNDAAGGSSITGLPTTSLPLSTSYSSKVPIVQSTSTNVPPATQGTVHTVLETAGRTSALPFPSTSASISSLIKIAMDSSIAVAEAKPTAALSANVFVAIATDAPPSQIRARSDHPVKKLGISPSQKGPLHTNKFYANLFLGSQNYAVWTHPYSVVWSKGTGEAHSWGLSISHTERSQLAWGPGSPPQYFINPIGIQSVILSAAELGPSTTLTTNNHQAFSVNAMLSPSPGAAPLINFPLVQGMGSVTGLYTGGTPLLQSGVQFRQLSYGGQLSNRATYKYRIVLEDGSNWLLYVTPTGSAGQPPFKLLNSRSIQGPKGFHGTIQVAKNPAGNGGEGQYDTSAGTYPVGATLSAAVQGKVASYAIFWKKAGLTKQPLLMFTLPHQVESLDAKSRARLTGIQLQTTTKGMATAISADSITMTEPNLPVDVGFGPETNNVGGPRRFVSGAAAAMIGQSALRELSQDMDAQSNLDSMYFSGKALSKYASVVYATQMYGSNSSLAAAGLQKLESAFSRFVQNRQKFPLAYDDVWKGAVSTGSYNTGNSGQDFGNSYYNDHHFHAAYFVHAAAVIAHLDPNWLKQGSNKAWVNMLVRDYANPVGNDPYFPFSRSFDWYHGHSWAKGLFDSPDGKDQESTSEDAFSAYAIKMWGNAIGDPNMEARGNLQLAILARSLKNYFLLENSNKNQPAQFLPNKVTGILFENKVDHTTYFGGNREYVQGIHMIPISPITAYTRSAQFTREEWQHYFGGGYCNNLKDGWRGILMANYAALDPKTSYDFFRQKNFDDGWLDGGASRTWYLTYAAMSGGGV